MGKLRLIACKDSTMESRILEFGFHCRTKNYLAKQARKMTKYPPKSWSDYLRGTRSLVEVKIVT